MTASDRRRAADRLPAVAAPTPPDPGAIIDDLRRRLRAEQERTLNATDAMRGARAEAAQARAEVRELHHRLHVRETELGQLEQLIGDGAIAARAPADPMGTASSVLPDGSETAAAPTPVQALRILIGSVARQLGLR